MIKHIFMIAIISLCVFTLSALAAYTMNYNPLSDSDAALDIEKLNNDIATLNEKMQLLQNEEDLMPVAQSWLKVLDIIDQYPDLIWHSDQHILSETETHNAWQAMMIASPDLIFPVMHLIQQTVPAEVVEIQLDQRQGVLSINILGVEK